MELPVDFLSLGRGSVRTEVEKALNQENHKSKSLNSHLLQLEIS